MKLTQKKALMISIELWEWLKESGNEFKSNWPGWKRYGKMQSHCPFCEYGRRRKESCESCPLRPFELDQETHCYATPYGDWEHASTKAKRKLYAGQFLELLKSLRWW